MGNKIIILFWNEDSIGNETNSHLLEYYSKYKGERLICEINETYYMLLNIFKFYSIVEIDNFFSDESLNLITNKY